MLIKKNVILFTDWYEPGFKAGGPIQSCKNLVTTFADEADFFIVTGDRDLGDPAPYPGITTDTWLTVQQANVYYASPAKLNGNRIRKLINEVSADIIYLNSMFSYRFTLLPLWAISRMNFTGRLILAPRGMLNQSALSFKKWKKTPFLSLLSQMPILKKIVFHATDPQEVADVQRELGKNGSTVLAANIPSINCSFQRRKKQPGNLKCIYLSRIHPVKNLLFALDVFKTVTNLAAIRFDIYGAIEDDRYYQQCFEAARALEGRIEINFMGPLEHNQLFDTLSQYHLFFLPTLGENFGHAIFEALSSGCPVLISDKTPWNDLEENNAGWSVPLSDVEKYKMAIEEVCSMSQEAFDKNSRAAFDYAQQFIADADFKNNYYQLFGFDKQSN